MKALWVRSWAAMVGGTLGIWLLASAPVLGATVAQAYKSHDKLPAGTVAMVDTSAGDQVQAADSDHQESLIGVVVTTKDSTLALGGSSSNQDTLVASAGFAQTLVSDINGSIKIGDKVAASPISGTGMKATQSGRVLGIAQADFDAATPNSIKRDVKDKSGKTQSVNVGQIPVLIDVTYYVSGTGVEKTVIPKFLQDLANAAAGRKVSAVRIILSGVLLILVMTLIVVFVYGSVRSSIISIGRNPLSQTSIRKGLLQVVAVAIAVLLVTLGAIYLILSR